MRGCDAGKKKIAKRGGRVEWLLTCVCVRAHALQLQHQELLAQHPPPNRPPPSALRTAATHLEQRLAALIQQHRRANLARADETMRTTLDAHLSYMEKCLGAAQRNLDEGGRPDVCRVWLRSLAESVAEVTRARKVQAKAELRLGDDEQQQQRPHANGHGDGELSSSSSPAVDMRLDMLVTRVVRAVRRVVPSAVDNDDVRLWSDAIRARMKALLVAAARAGHPPAARGAGWGVPGAGAGAGAVLLQAAARAG